VRREDEPRLVLPVHRGEAVLDEVVLRRAHPPVVLRVGDAEADRGGATGYAVYATAYPALLRCT
jgi:hypothetical protein